MKIQESIMEKILNHVKESLGAVNFGSIEIEINDTSDKIDIIVKDRRRFTKKRSF